MENNKELFDKTLEIQSMQPKWWERHFRGFEAGLCLE